MAKKAAVKPKTPGYDLDAGVGVQWATNDYGWGLEEMPHMAVLMHPLQGMTLWARSSTRMQPMPGFARKVTALPCTTTARQACPAGALLASMFRHIQKQK